MPHSPAHPGPEMQQILINAGWQADTDAGGSFHAQEPRRGVACPGHYPVSSAATVERIMQAATQAAPALARLAPERIAAFLESYAAGIAQSASTLAELAARETGLDAELRFIKVEIPRCVNQLRQAAQAARDRSWCEPQIDTRGGIRSVLGPLEKPVLVFGPNNFPFAFNAIAGSDFASALVARNPVIAKAHPLHPGTCEQLARIAHRCALENGLPSGAIQMLYALPPELGLAWVADRRLGAVAFTGSRLAGLRLREAAECSGVPFYAELGSLNPVFALRHFIERDAEGFASEFVASVGLGGGQFCTRPSVLVLPAGEHGDRVVQHLRARASAQPAAVLFSASAVEAFSAARLDALSTGAQLLTEGDAGQGDGFHCSMTLIEATAAQVLAHPEALLADVFGPWAVVVRVADRPERDAILDLLEGQLAASIWAHAHGLDDAEASALTARLRARCGRLVFNRMPTGVAVSPAMHHGGPFPAASHIQHTAVGMPAAIRRFAGRWCYDQCPQPLLPEELRDRNPVPGLQRCIDGVWRSGDVNGPISLGNAASLARTG